MGGGARSAPQIEVSPRRKPFRIVLNIHTRRATFHFCLVDKKKPQAIKMGSRTLYRSHVADRWCKILHGVKSFAVIGYRL